ncbi:MAG: 50S ribosomal protein L3 N(5)-glutamine methyltransferase [Betaproteobacteria bacterium]|nr:50S ribosomal protein L3 N(5)-glutamine methyltransferase [Betaproteobacteria bacterium]
MSSTASNPQSVHRAFRESVRRLSAQSLTYGHGTHNARDEAAWLMLHALRITPDELQAHFERPIAAVERKRLLALVERRIRERIPAAYLIREAWLGDTRFYVDKRVIVPRSFIYELLDGDLQMLLRRPVRRALDLCTGSGCLAILIAQAFPDAKIDAVDLSSGALKVAGRNVVMHRLRSRIQLIHSDLFAGVSRRRYDIILSNPPYVDAPSMRRLPAEYRHEPRMALAGGRDGLDLVRRILNQSRARLNPGGMLVCEIGHNRRALERAFPNLPFLWLETSAGDGMVFLLEREQLPA